MARVKALKDAYKESLYDQWYCDVSVSLALSSVGRSQQQQQQQQRHPLTPASEQHGRPSTQQRVASELGGGTQLSASGLTSRFC
ncbi:hypothetical protein PBY51_004126 [Eleginops maclovinus]|uniref:Uncharacterized protein n=1 Tax=Eleginops maclovinus TaxID=56733 RepID=A0AAN7Y366_ELEMC|nr:hypothetical protein PBY51_004126 [Eleginops maclovinus]